MRRECHEICRLCLQAAIFFECANQPSQDANIQNFLAEPSKCHVNSAAEEPGLKTMRTVKGRIVRRPDNCVTNEYLSHVAGLSLYSSGRRGTGERGRSLCAVVEG